MLYSNRRRWILAIALAIPVLVPVAATAQDVDTSPPQLIDLSFAPTSIDVSAGPQTVTATFQVTDDLSGVSWATVYFTSPSGQSRWNNNLQLIAGDARSGTFQGNVTFPRYSENGTWVVSSISLQDWVGNFTSISTAVLQARGLPTALTVSSVPTDVTAPTVTGIDISPSSVDVSTGSQEITVTLNVTDDLSGAMFGPDPSTSSFFFFPVQFRSPSGGQRNYADNLQFTLVEGTLLDGKWEAAFTIPRYSEPGTWQIDFIQLRDVTGNQRFLSAANLTALGLTLALNVSSDPADTTPPQVTGLSFTPTVINTSGGFQSVSVSLDITDDLAGADFSRDSLCCTFLWGVGFRSPSSQQSRSACCGGINLVAGTPLNGTWRGDAFFPQFSEDGTWRIDFLQIKDGARNVAFYDTAALEARGFPTQLVVLRPSLVGDGTISDPAGGGTVSDDTFGNRAEVTFPPGVLTEVTTVSIDVFQQPLDIPAPTGFQGPGTHYVNIELTPQPAFPLPAPGMTIVLPLPDPRPAGEALSLYRVDPGTGNLVPAIGVSGLPVIGSVNPGGLSATFEGVASLSTVVGLIPDVTPVVIDIMPGGFPNPLNCTAENGVVTVAILSTNSFDATAVNTGSVRFGKTGAEAEETHRDRNGVAARHVEDVNKDGRPDLVFHFRAGDIGYGCADVTGESYTDVVGRLTGQTQSAAAIAGEDMIRLRKR